MDDHQTTSKTCRTCGENKPLTQYHAAKKNRDGKRTDCIDCRREYQRAYVKANEDKVRKYRREHYQKNKDRIAETQAAWYRANKERRLETASRWYAENKDRAALTARKRKLRSYGLTLEDYEQMLDAQDGICPICLEELPMNKTACVDHCHETGKVRGLLHVKCNASLGGLGDNADTLRRAIAYLEAA